MIFANESVFPNYFQKHYQFEFLTIKISIMTIKSKSVLGVLGAITAGVAIGLLVAPEKGSEMRRRVKKTTGKWVDTLGHLFSHANGTENVAENSRKRSREMPPVV
jgi:hypothetical protein